LIHPGGSLIISKLETTLGITAADHTKSSWHVYKNKGNTSSVSIGAVIEQSRKEGEREGCVAVAFGPGVTVEMALFRRTGWKGRKGVNGETNGLAHVNGNGHPQAGVISGKVNGVTDGLSALVVQS
jgi:type III polyketide synthase